MAKRKSLSEQERAELVAYLDGELTGEAARSLEAKLALNPVYRAEAESLKKAWDLLDYLPRPEPSPSFTHRTVSKLRPISSKKVASISGRRWRLLSPRVMGGLLWAGCVAGAFFGGYRLFQSQVPREPGEAELIRDLRLVENKRYYDLVEDLEFLRALDHPELFGDEAAGR